MVLHVPFIWPCSISLSFNTESLKRWGIDDGDLFYVLIRKKDQPGQLQFATLPKVDYDIGKYNDKIMSMHHDCTY